MSEGHSKWTLQLIAERLVEMNVIEGISRETVRKALKKTNSSHAAELLVHFSESQR